MKKIVAFGLLVFILGLAISPSQVSAASGSVPPEKVACTDPGNVFPFNFLCNRSGIDTRSTGYDTNAVTTGGTDADQDTGGLNFDDGTNYTTDASGYLRIKFDRDINFQTGFQTGDRSSRVTAGGDRDPVLVWTYVLASGGASRSDFSIHDINVVNGVQGRVIDCPGEGNPPGSPGKTYYSTKSPYWNPTNTGGVNCHDQGKVVYWYFPNGISANEMFWVGSGPDKSFRFRVHFNKSISFCARQLISVGNQSKLFPSNNDLGGANDDSVSTGVAKAGDRRCYNMEPDPGTLVNKPVGSASYVCANATYPYGYYNVSRANDPDHPGSPVSYRIAQFGSDNVGQEWSSNPNGSIVASGNTDGNGNTQGGFGANSYVEGRKYRLVVRDIDTGKWIQVHSATAQQNCTPPQDTQCKFVTVHIGSATRIRVRIVDSVGTTFFNEQINNDKTFQYTPRGTDVNVYVDRYNSSGDIYSTDGTGGYTCYAPACSLRIVGPNDGPVVAGEPYSVWVTITNVDLGPTQREQRDIPDVANGRQFQLTHTTGASPVGTLAKGASRDVPIANGTAPNSGTLSFSAYPSFVGQAIRYVDPPGTESTTARNYLPASGNPGRYSTEAGYRAASVYSCSGSNVPVGVNHRFQVDPAVTITNNDTENPTLPGGGLGIAYQATGTWRQGFRNFTSTVTTTLSRESAGGASAVVDGPKVESHTYQPNSEFNYQYPVASFNAGDKYCARTTIDPAVGLMDDAGNIVQSEPRSAESSCFRLVNKPYVHFLGGDISAGGGFEAADDTCPRNAGGIRTFFNNTAAPSGSGVQIGALSIDPAYGFMSAAFRSSDPRPASGLTFSNNSNVSTSTSNAAGTGGLMNTDHCVFDYFNKLEKPAVDTTPSPVADVASGVARYYDPSDNGNVVINGGIVPLRNPADSSRPGTVIYVKGDVRIMAGATGGIKFAGGDTSYNSVENIPSLYVIVYGGNITIDRDVTQLDGVFVAQPENGVGGEIFTCDTNNTADLLGSCNKQLLVNGSFVAKKVNLLRSFGSLRDGLRNVGRPEDNPYAAGTKTCGVLNGTVTTTRNDCAAEIFRFNPEIYLAQPNLIPKNGPTKGDYDYITTLPPIL
jgi:hypothetical protein